MVPRPYAEISATAAPASEESTEGNSPRYNNCGWLEDGLREYWEESKAHVARRPELHWKAWQLARECG
jgi:hypothetical protein